MDFPFETLRRRPDVEGPDLVAVDAADRLILDVSTGARDGVAARRIAVIGDTYGALTLAASASASGPVRVHQDSIVGERALAANAADLGMPGAALPRPLDATAVEGARVVLLRLPRSLDALDDIAGLIARHADRDVRVFAGGRIKHMSLGMNDVLRRHFARVDVTHARQKSRVLIATGPGEGADPQPRRATEDGLVVCAYGGVFAGAGIDIGTRLLLAHLPPTVPADVPAVDLACGTGVIAAALASRHPLLRVHAADVSAAAVASARATAEANGVAERVRVVREDGLESMAEASAGFVALNPPFHSGAAVTGDLAPRLFADAARVLRPGGELWTVWNSPLRYRTALEQLVGPTRQIARNAKFTVTASTRR
ncbi:methyltransferase [Microbacterium sp. Marseille-Q6648]|uniref:class I SAM-dependent methyltransferase n=1 Tax=Microbacterium sp. Marseille-Q6648 TaxID=2937991 RepID=UPI00203B978D|nr:methyltransferase [Microbacterium sp. Marseille-Q6648]